MAARRAGVVAGVAALAAACGGDVSVRGTIPLPIVEPVPYTMGVHFTEQFQSYEFDEVGEKWDVEIGPQSAQLFEALFGRLFQSTVTVDTFPPESAVQGVDGILVPEIDEYSYISPADTGGKFYAVSIRYRIRIYSPSGEEVAYWPFLAYGKSRSKTLSQGESLGEATIMAIRDAVAAMTTDFRKEIAEGAWTVAEGQTNDTEAH